MKKIIAFTLIFMLAACAKATTRAPKVSKDELRQEQQAQAGIVQQAQAQSQKAVANITAETEQKFRAVATRVAVAGEDLCSQLGAKKCSFDFKLEESGDLNAYADGSNIVISSAMANFADYDELANVISHEYSHNLMGHVGSIKQNATLGTVAGSLVDIFAASQGVDTGGNAGKLGASVGVMHYSQDFEREADYVGLYVMDRAGYDINKAPNFWRKMSVANPDGIKAGGRYSSSHPSNPERYIALNKTINEINHKKQSGQPLVPGFKQ